MNKYKLNIVFSLVLILFGLLVWTTLPLTVEYSNIHSGMSDSEILSSHFMPKVIVVILWLSSTVNIVMNCINLRHVRATGKNAPKKVIIRKDELKRVLVFIAIFTIYAVLLLIVGFLPSSIISCVLLLLFLRIRKWWFYAIDIAFIFVVYGVFKYLLYVQL